MDLLLLVAGLACLWFGTEAAIRGAVTVADHFGVSEFVVGIVVLSVGSDLPELAIAVDAAIKNLGGGDFSDLVVGSALGSGLGQIGFVLGIAGMLAFLSLPKRVVYRHGSLLLGSLVVLGAFGLDGYVTRTEGLVLVSLYLAYIVLLLADTAHRQQETKEERLDGLGIALLSVLVGLGIVIYGAELTVTSASSLALALGIEEAFVAVVIIGLGSSLPELSISVAAVLKGRTRLSVGNLIGSNIFDTLVPVGVAAGISGLTFNRSLLQFELPFLLLLSAVALIFFIRERGVRSAEAAVILGAYLVYVTVKLISVMA